MQKYINLDKCLGMAILEDILFERKQIDGPRRWLSRRNRGFICRNPDGIPDATWSAKHYYQQFLNIESREASEYYQELNRTLTKMRDGCMTSENEKINMLIKTPSK